MRHATRRRLARRAAISTVLALIAGLAGQAAGAQNGGTVAPHDGTPQQALVAKGAYLARVGDCVACHTAPGGQPFAGGLAFTLPIGTIYSTNITPDPKTGLGGYAEVDFARAVRRGIAKDGTSLYPAMPFPSYARVSDEDIDALYAYFMHGVPPVAAANRTAEIRWPLSMRWPLALWRALFGPGQPQPAAADRDPVRARGAYLVEGLGHCGACHTPRGIALQEQALSEQGGSLYLSGGAAVDGWIPQSLRGDRLTGLGAWSETDIVEFLETGRNRHGSAFGGMSAVVQDSMQFLTDEDLRAIAHYLKTLPPSGSARDAEFRYDDTIAKQLYQGQTTVPGALDYINRCAACHRTDGHGYPTVFPTLAGNPVLQSPDPQALIRIVLVGSTVPATRQAPSAFTMPGFGGRLSDEQVADVVSFIRGSWGNLGGPVTAAAVAKIRKTLPVLEATSAAP